MALLLLGGCATPVQVQRVGPRAAQRELTSNVISTGRLSAPTQTVLRRNDLWNLYRSNPESAIALLHRTVAADDAGPDTLFALAEMCFRHAEDSGQRPYFLAATVYAFAFLFPDDPAERPNRFDPRVRTASDIYNRSLTSAFASADRTRVAFSSGTFALPFGTMAITFDSATARWGNLSLTDFTPADELRVIGLNNLHRRFGLGASLAANASSGVKETGFHVSPLLRVPVTALLRIDLTREGLARGHLDGRIDLYSGYDLRSVTIRGQSTPLESNPSAVFAYGLSDPRIWRSEFAGFLRGDFFDRSASQLVAIQPYVPGEIPVVFIHGTASSAGRWADLINDLHSDATIRRHFQFWLFSYNTGNPMPYSALQLRTALQAALHQLDPEGKDPALHDMVLIGHSQGGLLAKMLVIDSGSRLWDAVSSRPLDQLRVSAATRDLLRRTLFVTPLPSVRSVIFIATPHRGSYVAGSWIAHLVARLVTLPIGLTKAMADAIEGNIDAMRVNRGVGGFGSVWSMTPRNPTLQALAAIPISPDVSAHSIIAVRGNGPIETGSDGVVTYQSAHLAGVSSELVVRDGHSVQSNPHTVAEVLRILLLHLATTCPHGCSPGTVAEQQAPVATLSSNTSQRRPGMVSPERAPEPAR
ncbi:MAG: esterase/lipase family protein [Acetobacteraceae bacterium]